MRSTAAFPSPTICFQPRNDTVNVGSDPVNLAQSTLDAIHGPVAIDGAGGNDSLNVNDQGTSTSQNWDVASSFIDRYSFGGSRPTVPQITYYGVATVTVTAGSAQDFIVVPSTNATTTTVVNGGGGSDYINVENIVNSLDDLRGPLAAHDAAPYNLMITDRGSGAPHDYLLSSGQLGRDGIMPITFDSDVSMVLDCSPGGGAVNVPSFTGTGFAVIAVVTKDIVTIGDSSAGLSNITADVRVQASVGQTPQVLLDDAANQSGRAFDLGSDPAFGYLVNGHMDPIRGRIGLLLDPAAPVLLKAGSLDDSFQVHDLVGIPALTLDGNGGNNTLQGPDGANTWQISGANSGSLNGTVKFVSVQNLTGGSSSDIFNFQTGGSLAGNLDGGAGANTLDYSAYATGITVNLLGGQATDVIGGLYRIQNVTGGSGNDFIVGDGAANVLVGNVGSDVLIGSDGDDILNGGSGRDLLIGGLGADRLDSGTEDDILIAGFTDFDTQLNSIGVVSHNINRTALDAVMLEWSRTDLDVLGALDSYKMRVDHLLSGVGGLNGSTVLKASGRNAVVHDLDGASDVLTGGAGYDWFFAAKPEETPTDALSQEKVT